MAKTEVEQPDEKKKRFIPAFLVAAGIEPGEWMYTSKPALRVLMRPNFEQKVRVWACLMLQSAGHERALSVVMTSGPRIFGLVPAGIKSQLMREVDRAAKESGVKLSDQQRDALKISSSH